MNNNVNETEINIVSKDEAETEVLHPVVLNVLNEPGFHIISSQIERSTVCLTKQNHLLFKQNQENLKETYKLNETIDILKGTIKEMALEIKYLREIQREHNLRQEALQRRREMKTKRKKADLRDRVTFSDLKCILQITSASDYESTRSFVAIIILYITGLRVANLCYLRVSHLNDLREKGFTLLQIIKNGPPRHTVQLSIDDSRILESAEKKINILCTGKRKTDPVFIGKGNRSNKGMAIHQGYLCKSLNKIPRIASDRLGKNIRTHSFRVSRISDLLENTDVREVANIIGHRSINSTKVYDRVKVNFEKVHNLFDEHRQVNVSALDSLCTE